jgi:GTP-binding protein
VHLLDLSGLTEGDPAENLALVNQELALYRRSLSKRPQIIAANKMDSPEAADKLAQLQDKLGEKQKIWPISALTGEGIKPLLGRIWKILEDERTKPLIPEEEEVRLTRVRPEEPWQIRKLEQDLWQVTGEEVEKLVAMTDWENEDAVARMQRKFMAIGLDGALKAAGLQEGDSIRIGREEFEYAD